MSVFHYFPSVDFFRARAASKATARVFELDQGDKEVLGVFEAISDSKNKKFFSAEFLSEEFSKQDVTDEFFVISE